MNWKQRYHREQESGKEGIDISGILEIDYVHTTPFAEEIVELKVTISYRLWSIDTESVEAHYKIIGSANYLPEDFEQLVRDYLHELHEMKGLQVGKIQKNLSI